MTPTASDMMSKIYVILLVQNALCLELDYESGQEGERTSAGAEPFMIYMQCTGRLKYKSLLSSRGITQITSFEDSRTEQLFCKMYSESGWGK